MRTPLRHLSIFLLFIASPILAQTTQPPTLPFTLSKETTIITSPVLPDGTPDYIGVLNARAAEGVAADNNAFLLLLHIEDVSAQPQVLSAHVKLREFFKIHDPLIKSPGIDGYAKTKGLPKPVMDKLARDLLACTGKLWRAEDFPDVADYLQAEQPALDLVVEASSRPRWYFPILPGTTEPRLANIDFLPTTFAVRLGRTLAARATLRAASSDFDGFLRDTIAIERIARHLASGPLLLEYQKGYMTEGNCCRATGAALGKGLLNASQCEALSKALAALPPFPGPVTSLESERWTALEYACLTAAGKVQTMKDPDKLLASIDASATDWNGALQEINALVPKLQPILSDTAHTKLNAREAQFNDELDVWKGTPIEKRAAVPKIPGESREQYSRHVGQAIFSHLDYAFSTAEMFRRDVELYQNMQSALLAAATFRAKTGDWPDTLDQLVPQYLKQVPTDPYSPSTKDPVKFLVNINAARIYSVGPNGIDDLGISDRATQKDDITLGQLESTLLPPP